MEQDGPKLRAEAAGSAKKWANMNGKLRRATAERNVAMWKFIRAVVKIARREQLLSRRKIRHLVRELHPDLDGKSLSRYVGIVRAIVRRKPAGITIAEWVKSEGGVARCH